MKQSICWAIMPPYTKKDIETKSKRQSINMQHAHPKENHSMV